MDHLKEFEKELTDNILKFWMERMPDHRGGFYGQMDGNGQLNTEAPKGAILNARILWTFASAYRLIREPAYLGMARRAKFAILDNFIDPEYGGLYWSVSAEGEPLDTKKQFYAIAFAIYGLAELYRAAGDKDALKAAKALYRSIEDHSHDSVKGGYLEACTRDWQPISDMRLSEKDQNDAKTMNTHLHILEAYTGLYRVWKDEELEARLRELIEIFLDKISGEDGHLQLFFDEDWKRNGCMVSYGHDIEASWLILEAAEVLGDEDIVKKAKKACAHIATAAMEGLREDGSLIYEYDPADGRIVESREWWVQAETVVGCYNQYQQSGDSTWLERSMAAWEYIKKNIICPDGEWYWGVNADGTVNTKDDRAGFWKCPYHNGRMCMEIIERNR